MRYGWLAGALFGLLLGIVVIVLMTAEPEEPHSATRSNHDGDHDARGYNEPFRGAYSDGDLDELQQLDFNATHVTAWSTAELDALAERGMRGIAWTGEWLRSACRFTASDAQLARWLTEIRDHPALFAVQLSDEPRQAPSEDGCYNAVAQHESRRNLISTLAPDVPTFVTLDATQTQQYAAWKGVADIYGLVLYPCTRESNDCDYELIRTEVTAANSAGLKRLIGVVQTFGNSWARMPSSDELNRMLMLWRALGVTDYYYYVFSGYEPQGIEDSTEVRRTVEAWNETEAPAERKR